MSSTLRVVISTIALMAGSAGIADTLRIGGTGVALGSMAQLGKAFETHHPDTQVEVLPSLGSSGGIKALLAGAIDVGLSSRDLKDTERDAGVSARIYAHTPLAVVTSLGTSVDGVTTRDLEEIYSGTMTHWPDGTPIRVIMRPANETDTQLLRTLSGPMATAVDLALKRPGLVSATNDQENAEVLEDLPGSVGLVALGQIAAEQRQLKVLTLDGEVPEINQDFDPETSFAKTLYLVSREEMSPLANEFIAFVISAEGWGLLAATGHAPVQ